MKSFKWKCTEKFRWKYFLIKFSFHTSTGEMKVLVNIVWFWWFLDWVGVGLEVSWSDLLVDPVSESGNVHVDTWSACFSTSNSPCCDTSLIVVSVFAFHGTDQRTSSITFACVCELTKKRQKWVCHRGIPTSWSLPFPGSPPAHKKLLWRLKRLPSRVFLKLSWQGKKGTTGSSIFLRMTWYFPSLPKTSLPQPLAKHLLWSKTVSWGGRQIVLTCCSNLTASFRNSNAISLWRPPL